jgi:hypothetical protein
MRRGGRSGKVRVWVEENGIGFSRPFLTSGRIGPSTNLRAGPYRPACLSSGLDTTCSLGPCQPGPASYRVVPCLGQAKLAGLVPCEGLI